ncbi:MAG: hypothetical protein OEV86_15770 [Candidatus Krumholzibacteria bacterium]|nr:hypothetical protein [Candidatus Krumholzibacteria bacterium]
MNFAYHDLTGHLPSDSPVLHDINLALAPPEEKQKTIDRQNADAQKRLMAVPGFGVAPPPPRRKPKVDA